jgi:hypothetical protein
MAHSSIAEDHRAGSWVAIATAGREVSGFTRIKRNVTNMNESSPL